MSIRESERAQTVNAGHGRRAGVWIVVVALSLATAAIAADREASRLVAEANAAMASGRIDEALELYDRAASKAPDSPELAYNRGVAFYRKGDRAKAAEQFLKALASRDLQLEAKAKFNLGNCAYADALDKQGDVKAALEQLKLAISYYKDAIAADPADLDAKVNMETAQLFMKHLLDQEKNKQEEQQKNEQNQSPQSQPESQPASQPESQPEQPQSQPASQPESNEQKQQDGQKQEGEDQEGHQQESAEQQDSQQGEKQEQKGEDGEGKKLEAQEQKGGQGQKDDQAKKDDGSDKSMLMIEMTPEQAERLLQKIRDRERQRREALLRMRQLQQVPVDKDW